MQEISQNINYTQWLKNAQNKCKESGVELTAPLIFLEYVLEKSRVSILTHGENLLSDKEKILADSLLARRLKQEPLAYILNTKEFYGRDFYVDKHVLIPRPESELIIDMTKEFFKNSSLKAQSICDIGTGSGCLAISLALEIDDAQCIAYDISEKALEIAKNNAKNFHIDMRIDFRLQDITRYENEDKENFTCIVSNPPYIPEHEYQALEENVKDFEPILALTSGKSGLEIIEKVLEFADYKLAQGGLLLIEHGYNQHTKVQELAQSIFSDKKWESLESIKDYADKWRFFKAIKK